MKRNDWFLAAGILAAAAILFCFQIFGNSGDQAVVSISVDGALYGTYSLEEDRTVKIDETNRLATSGGTVKMDWAYRPDQFCVNHRSISSNGATIICLPKRVVASLDNGDSGEDAGNARWEARG